MRPCRRAVICLYDTVCNKSAPASPHLQEQKVVACMGTYKHVCGVSSPVHPHFNAAVWRNICSLITQTLVTSNLHTGTACWAFWILNLSKKQTAGHLLWTQLSISTIAFSEIYCCNKSTSFYCHGWCLPTVLAQISSLDLKKGRNTGIRWGLI